MIHGAGGDRCRCSECVQRFAEHHAANHSRRRHAELSRSTIVLDSVVIFAFRPGMARTMTPDAERGQLNRMLPKHRSARTLLLRVRLGANRGAQFKRNSTADKWPLFVHGARAWAAECASAKARLGKCSQ